MRVTLETITPQDAERLLQYNAGNRFIRKKRVALYAKQMANGQWRATGEALKFSSTGRLLDGQHRLHAVVLAGVPTQFLVIRDLDDEVFKVLDSGLARGASDVVRSLGVGSPSDASAITRMYLVASSGLNPANTNVMTLVTKTDIASYVETHKDLLTETTSVSRNTRNAVGGSTTSWGAARLMASDTVGVAEFDKFVAGVVSGAGLSAGDPRLALRNWLSRNFKPSTSGVTAAVHLGTYMKAFVAYLNGDQIHLLRTWDSKKPMPIPVATPSSVIFTS